MHSMSMQVDVAREVRRERQWLGENGVFVVLGNRDFSRNDLTLTGDSADEIAGWLESMAAEIRAAGDDGKANGAVERLVLMSAENPTGFKLEDLLAKLQGEIEVKNSKIVCDESELSRAVQKNNQTILSLLKSAEGVQRDSYSLMAKKASDSGPSGVPRIGGYQPVGGDVAAVPPGAE